MKAIADGIEPNTLARALLFKEDIWHDVYVGTADDLVRAGLARMDMFPGQPGRGKMQCSFKPLDTPGLHCGSGRSKLVIRRKGKERFEISWPVEKEQGERRREAWRAAYEAEQAKRQAASSPSATQPSEGELRGAMFFSLGRAFTRAYEASPARFNVGDRATYCHDADDGGCAVEIVKAFDEYDVTDVGHRLGYVVRDEKGKQFFAAAHHLLEDGYGVRHLMLVHGRGQAPRQVKQEDGSGRWL